MTAAGICYLGAAFSYAYAGQPWMGLTMFFYAITIGTIYMAGTN